MVQIGDGVHSATGDNNGEISVRDWLREHCPKLIMEGLCTTCFNFMLGYYLLY